MVDIRVFVDTPLTNRLGQAMNLKVAVVRCHGRELAVVITPANVPNFLAKNGETLAFQLRQLHNLDQTKFEFFELKLTPELPLTRWRFDWVGASPIAQGSEMISSESQRQFLLGLLSAAPDRAIA